MWSGIGRPGWEALGHTICHLCTAASPLSQSHSGRLRGAPPASGVYLGEGKEKPGSQRKRDGEGREEKRTSSSLDACFVLGVVQDALPMEH